MKYKFEITEIIGATPEVIYKAWLDSELHTKMTGGEAVCSTEVNGSFTTWDNYISGTNLGLLLNKTILQSWRTSEFNESEEDSILKIELTEVVEGTQMKLSHSNIPHGQSNYEAGWIEHYFVPMKAFFEGK